MTEVDPTIFTFVLVILFGILAGRIADHYSFPRMVPLILSGILMSLLATYTNLQIDLTLLRDTALIIAELALIIILFREGMHLDIKSFKKHLLPILVLAILGTFITVVLVGITVFVIFGTIGGGAITITILSALLIGSIIVPTDPAATFSILRGSGAKIKEKMEIILGGESALNDSIAILLVVIIIVPQLRLENDFLQLSPVIIAIAIWEGIGGILVGLLVGIGALYIINILKNQTEYSYITLAAVFLIFTVSIPLSISSAIAALIAGVVIRNPSIVRMHNIYFVRTRLYDFWDDVVFLFEIIAFVLIGSLFNIGANINYLIIAVILSIVSVIGRVGGVFISTVPLDLNKKTKGILSNKEKFFVSFSGFKGLTTGILATFAYFELIKTHFLPVVTIILYSSILLILILGTIQGVTVPAIAKKFDVIEEIDETEEIQVKIFALKSELEKLIKDRSSARLSPGNFRKITFPIKDELYLLEERYNSLIAQKNSKTEYLEYRLELVEDTINQLDQARQDGEISSVVHERIIKNYNHQLEDLRIQISKIAIKPEPLTALVSESDVTELELSVASDVVESMAKDPILVKKIPELAQIGKMLKNTLKTISRSKVKEKKSLINENQGK